jgi:hypothetical protein
MADGEAPILHADPTLEIRVIVEAAREAKRSRVDVDRQWAQR